MNSRSGLALVELAIVLVVVGLVIGGVLIGQSIVRAGQLRAISSEYQLYAGAVQNFRTKYTAIPGDMRNATSFWGDNSTACSDAAITNGDPGTCNGDGDATIEAASAADATGEMFQFWNQLSSAGLIGGYFSGTAGAGSTTHCVLGTNCPKAKMQGGGWGAYYVANYAGSADIYALDYGNYLFFGGQSTDNLPTGSLLTPQEAYDIDTKLDDGRPGTGLVIAYRRANCADASAVDDYDSAYRLTTTTVECALYFIKVF